MNSSLSHSRKEQINYSSFFEPPIFLNKSRNSSKEETEVSINHIKSPESPIRKEHKFMTCSEINNLINSLVSGKNSNVSSSKSNQTKTKFSEYYSNNYQQVTPMTKNMIERRKLQVGRIFTEKYRVWKYRNKRIWC